MALPSIPSYSLRDRSLSDISSSHVCNFEDYSYPLIIRYQKPIPALYTATFVYCLHRFKICPRIVKAGRVKEIGFEQVTLFGVGIEVE